MQYRTDPLLIRRTEFEIDQVVRVLKEGDAHTHFGHLLDRFYHSVYLPWRESRRDVMADQFNHAALTLGAYAMRVLFLH